MKIKTEDGSTSTLTNLVLGLLPGHEVVHAANQVEQEFERQAAHIEELKMAYDQLWEHRQTLISLAQKVADTPFHEEGGFQENICELDEEVKRQKEFTRYPTKENPNVQNLSSF